MKTILTFALMILVVSMVVGTPAFADSKLDSLVNLATQARSQVKLQLDKLPNVSDEVSVLYGQGNQETELLISAVKQGDVTQAKQHFLAAMKIFRQITTTFSELPPASLKSTPPQASPVREFDYGNAIKRIENNANMLKGLAAKNNISVDFTRIDSLIQLARTSLANGDIPTLEKTYGELKTAITEIQSIIKEMTTQRSNDRAKSFVSSYITKIDAILAKAKELRLSEDDIAKLTKAKEELSSTSDPNQIIITIKRYTVNININESTNQRVLTTAAKLDSRLVELEPYIDDIIRPKFDAAKEIVNKLRSQETTDDPILLNLLNSTINEIQNHVQSKQVHSANTERAETGEQKKATQTETTVEKSTTDSKEDRIKQREATKNQKTSAEIARLEARFTDIQPYVDDNIKSRSDKVESLLAKLKNQETVSNADYLKTVRMLDLLLDQMERYVKSLQAYEDKNPDQDTTKEQQNQETGSSDTKRPSK